MTDEAKLIMLKVFVNENGTEYDSALTVYLAMAKSKILARAFPYDPTQTEVPSRYDVLQCEIAAYLWNKRGAEGQTAHTENGISRQYEKGDVPESLMGVIVPYCGTFTTETGGE